MTISDVLIRLAVGLIYWLIWVGISTTIYYVLEKRFDFRDVHGCVGIVLIVVMILGLIYKSKQITPETMKDFREAAEKYAKITCDTTPRKNDGYPLTLTLFELKEHAKIDFEQGAEHGYSEAKKEVREWIPVSERLPEEDGYQCIVFLQFRLSEPETICALFSDGYFYNLEDRGHAFRNVTHWMPLPEPPKSLASFTEQEQKSLPFE